MPSHLFYHPSLPSPFFQFQHTPLPPPPPPTQKLNIKKKQKNKERNPKGCIVGPKLKTIAERTKNQEDQRKIIEHTVILLVIV